jgi:WD40 repeat protein
VQIYELGEHEGRLYCAFELLSGGNLVGRGGEKLPPRQAAELVKTLAAAIHFAHTKGIVHRDLKPANILLTGDDTPKVCDFGILKLLDSPAGPTRAGEVLGTPSYMAPEQASSANKVGPPADVYALGAILYELLTGRPPFQAADLMATLEQVRSQEPQPPRRLRTGLPRDLETICLKCLEKDLVRRYASAAALEDDLSRFLRGEPTPARPVGRLERVWRWCQRRPAVAALLAGIALTLVGGFTTAWVLYGLARHEAWQKDEALREKDKAVGEAMFQAECSRVRAEYADGIGEADRLLRQFQAGLARQVLDDPRRCDPRSRAWEWHYLRRLSESDTLPAVGKTFREPVRAVAFSPDGKRLALALGNGSVQLWDRPQVGAPWCLRKTLLPEVPGAVVSLAFSPDGGHLAAAGFDDSPSALTPGRITLWDLGDDRPPQRIPSYDLFVPNEDVSDSVQRLAFHPTGRYLAFGAEAHTVKIWDCKEQHFLPPLKAGAPVLSVAFSADGLLLASAGHFRGKPGKPGEIQLWNWQGPDRNGTLFPSSGPFLALAFRPDGRHLAVAGAETVDVWRLEGQPVRVNTLPLSSPGRCVAYSPDGKVLVTGTKAPERKGAGYLTRWEAERYTLLGPLLGHADDILGLTFSPNSELLVSAGGDGTVRLWPTPPGTHGLSLPVDDYRQKVFGSEGRRRFAVEDGAVQVWDVPTEQIVLTIRHEEGRVLGLAFYSEDHKLRLRMASDKEVTLDGAPLAP